MFDTSAFKRKIERERERERREIAFTQYFSIEKKIPTLH
jgi:hypothetical protein